MRLGGILKRLRRRPTRAELVAEVELWRGRCDRKSVEVREAHVRAKAAEKQAREIRREVEQAVHNVIDRLNEPPGSDGCHKLRFHRQPEAEEWAAAIARDTRQSPDAYNTYQCKVCPRSPFTTGRYWHVGHISREVKTAETAAARRRQAANRANGTLLEQRLDPATRAKLRELKRGSR